MTPKLNALETLSAMNEAQTTQFVAATLLAMAVMMKKTGMTEVTITQEDFKLLEPGETLHPIPNVGGGYTYRFAKALAPLAKLPTPAVMKKTTRKRSK